RCDPYVNLLMGGESFDFHCHSNLTRAVVPFGLTELDVHDVLNVFQVTGLGEEGKYFMETSPAKPGEYFEFFAEVDVLCTLSTCPGGMFPVSHDLKHAKRFLQATFPTGVGRTKEGRWEPRHAPWAWRYIDWQIPKLWVHGGNQRLRNMLEC